MVSCLAGSPKTHQICFESPDTFYPTLERILFYGNSKSMKAAPFSMLRNSHKQLGHLFIEKTQARISRDLTTHFLNKVAMLYDKLPKSTVLYLKYIYFFLYTFWQVHRHQISRNTKQSSLHGAQH